MLPVSYNILMNGKDGWGDEEHQHGLAVDREREKWGGGLRMGDLERWGVGHKVEEVALELEKLQRNKQRA